MFSSLAHRASPSSAPLVAGKSVAPSNTRAAKPLRICVMTSISARAEIAQLAHRYREHREVGRFGGAKIGEDLAEALVDHRVARFPGRDEGGGVGGRSVGPQRIGGNPADHARQAGAHGG